MKTSTTATAPFFIRVVKHELTADVVLNIAHLCPNNCHQSLTINDYLDSLLLHNLVKLAYTSLVNVVHLVSEAVAALFSKTYFNAY